MKNKLQNAFDKILATEKMKQNTTTFLQGEISKRKPKKYKLKRYAVAFCLTLFLLTFTIGYSIYQTPVSYISVDVNPSIELWLNRFDRVVKVLVYNDDGAKIMKNQNLVNKTYTQAVELLLSDTLFKSYLSKDSLLSFTVISDNDETLLEGIKQCHGYKENKAQGHISNQEHLKDAHHYGLSFGKYQAFLQLAQYDKTITIEDCQSMSMREIRERIQRYDLENEINSPKDGHHGSGQGNHQGQGNGYKRGH